DHPDERCDRDRDQPALRLADGGEHLGVRLGRKADPLQRLLDVSLHGAGVTTLDVRRDVEVAGDGLPLDDGRAWHDPSVGHSAQSNVAAIWGVDEQIADAREAAPRARRTPDDHVEDLLLLEQTPRDDAREESRGSSAYVAWLDAVPLAGEQVDLDLECRLHDGRVHPFVD